MRNCVEGGEALLAHNFVSFLARFILCGESFIQGLSSLAECVLFLGLSSFNYLVVF